MKARFPFLLALLIPLLSFGADVPENLGLGLKQLVESYQTDQTAFRAKISSSKIVQADAADRVAVNIHLNGARTLEEVKAELQGLGLKIADINPNWRSGVISAWLPISQAIAVAKMDGVRSVILAPPPRRRVGSVTAESSVVERTQQVNMPGLFSVQGILGAGISVGIMSDSYDSSSSTPDANLGVASGDLPGPGNPSGFTTPVVVLEDGSTNDTDEGRGMAEIVHDLAPAAKLCFRTSGNFQSSMANNIRSLRTSAATLCDIIVDDIYFYEEPVFSDGPIAQAIDDVVTSNVLAGKKVVYFSAAGNDGNNAYSSNLDLVTPTEGKNAVDNLKFTGPGATPPPALYAGGFHNLNPGGPTKIAMSVTTNSGPTVALQWDDPFDTGGVTTDYNLLVFSSTGNYLGAMSGIDNNFSTQEPIELISNLGSNTTYQLVIALGSSAPPIATHLHLGVISGDTVSSPYVVHDAISIFGHAAAANANAVGAYVYSNTSDTTPSYNPGHVNPPPGPYRPVLEDFSSTGGNLSFYFDASGSRLASPNVRPKPEISACDGVNTSFFGDDYDNDNFPNFFGTSAAAPNAAAIAALVFEAAGGPGSRTPDQVRTLMQQSTFPHDLNPDVCNATASDGVATVQVSANGNASNDSSSSPTFFTATFNGNSGQTLNELVIDLTNTPLVFDESGSGTAFTIGSNSSGISVSHTLSANSRVLTLTFGSTFQPGQTISFGIDRDISAISAGGNSADLLAGAKIKATVDSSTTLLGGFANQLGAGFTFADGFGLVDARRAVASILASPPASTSFAANISTRAVTDTGDNVLIGGFIVQGSASKKVIVRALGPSLTDAGVAGALADPTLELHDGQGSLIAFDDNWQDDPDQATQIQATGLVPNDPSESALVETLAPAGYTAIVRGVSNTSGVALVEVYDLDSQPAASQLINISTRAPVQTGDNVMIGGFIINGSDPTNVIVRVLGPSLAAAGVAGVLPDPTIELHDGQGALLASNDDWQQDSLLATQIQATGLAPNNALESAIFTSLSAGAYTAIVRGANGTTGVGLIEVYNLK